jgi:hypothetical protein
MEDNWERARAKRASGNLGKRCSSGAMYLRRTRDDNAAGSPLKSANQEVLHMKKSVLILLVAATPLRAQVVTEMTPERVAEAIAFGSQAKRMEYPRVKGGRAECALVTPFLRVARAAFDAKRTYKTFAPADATPDMLAANVDVVCPSQCVVEACNRSFGVATVQAVVITEKGGASPQQPISSQPMPEIYQNAFGVTDQASGLLATFPAAALQPERELHVVFDKKVSAKFSKCDDCKIDLKLDGVR